MITDDNKPCPACINEYAQSHDVANGDFGGEIGDLAEFGPLFCPDHSHLDLAKETAKALELLPAYELWIGQPVVNTFKRNLRLVN